MVFKVLNYFNVNEVEVTQKNHKNTVFLKDFFNYLVKIVFSGNISCFNFQ